MLATAARSIHYLAQSSKTSVKLLTCCTAFRSIELGPLDRLSDAFDFSFLFASIEQPLSIVLNFKPFTYDTSLSTLSKVHDKACSIKCSKLTSLLRLLALALTISPSSSKF